VSIRQPNALSPSLGFTSRQVTVSAITPDGLTAVCIDKTGVEVRLPLLWSRAKGVLPAPGENWIVSQDFGRWVFSLFLGASAASFPALPAAAGMAAMTAGQVVVPSTVVAAGSLIMLTIQVPGGTVGVVYVSARVPGTSFTIKSTSSADTSVVGYRVH
jgi:hypothetical protein